MLDYSQRKPCYAIATRLYVSAYGSKRPYRKPRRGPITIKWLYRSLDKWINGNGTEEPCLAFIAFMDEEMAELIARQSLLQYDKTKLVAIIMAVCNNHNDL
jgi:hypothetical protein